MRVRLVKMFTNVQIVANPIRRSPEDFHIYIEEARKFVSMVNDSSAQMSYASMTKSDFTSVETQTDLICLNKADKLIPLTVNITEKIYNYI